MITQLLNTNNSFEIVRDAVASILYTELNEQLALAIAAPDPVYEALLRSFFDQQPDTTDELNLFVERFVRFDVTELNNINLYWDRSFLGKGTQITNQKSNARIIIDVNVHHKGTEDDRGDKKASLVLQKMIGVIRSIIMHGNYVTLGFARPFIERRWIEDMNNFRPQENENRVNIDNIITGNLALSVEFKEKNLGVAVEELEENYSKIDADTGKFKIETEDLYP